MEVEDRCMKKTLKPTGILDRIILINRTAVDFSQKRCVAWKCCHCLCVDIVEMVCIVAIAWLTLFVCCMDVLHAEVRVSLMYWSVCCMVVLH